MNKNVTFSLVELLKRLKYSFLLSLHFTKWPKNSIFSLPPLPPPKNLNPLNFKKISLFSNVGQGTVRYCGCVVSKAKYSNATRTTCCSR